MTAMRLRCILSGVYSAMKLLKALIIIVAISIFFYTENNILSVTWLQFTSNKLPGSFDKYRIVQLSDLHGKEFGKGNHALISLTKMLKPDLIIVTGDLINADSYNENGILSFMDSIKKLAPVYYVTGNHEIASRSFSSLEQKLRENGIEILRNSHANIRTPLLHVGVAGPPTQCTP